MTMMSDLSQDLVEEILCRTPLSSLRAVRLTSKQWNASSKDRILCKARGKHQFLGFMKMGYSVCSVRFQGELDDLSINQIQKLDQFKIYKIFHCKGLLLCLTLDMAKLVVWNPYLNQIRIIEPTNHSFANYYGIGCDSCGRYKILRFLDCYQGNEYEIYDFDSNSWRSVDVSNNDWYLWSNRRGVSLKGNTYWIAHDESRGRDYGDFEDVPELVDDFLLYFDFTSERFGPRLKLPFKDFFIDTGYLYCVREEQLAVMIQQSCSWKMEIWLTTKVEPEDVSWSKFLVFDMTPSEGIKCAVQHGSFFIDEEKKVAMFFDLGLPKDKNKKTERGNIVYIIGEDGYYKEVDLEGSPCRPVICPYVPSLAQI